MLLYESTNSVRNYTPYIYRVCVWCTLNRISMYIILHYLTENWMISAMWQFTVGQLVQLLQYAENKKKNEPLREHMSEFLPFFKQVFARMFVWNLILDNETNIESYSCETLEQCSQNSLNTLPGAVYCNSKNCSGICRSYQKRIVLSDLHRFKEH